MVIGQLDLTTVIAVAGLSVGLLSLNVTVRRDRALGRVRVRVTADIAPGPFRGELDQFRVSFANPERRTVSVQRAGLAVERGRIGVRRHDLTVFKGWNAFSVSGDVGQFPAFYGGIELEPGSPAREVRAEHARRGMVRKSSGSPRAHE